MKELSIEEKAKRYDEALEYAHYLINERCEEGTDGSFHRADLDKMFLELAESEDERIRKLLMGGLKLHGNEIFAQGELDMILAWLEKQGEKGINGNNREIPNSEQKPADKVKPKFKVGDWVVYNRNDHSREVIQIYDIRDNRYYFNDNIHFSWSVKECDEKSHLWTIQDAKDGDVLIDKSGSREGPFIFKETKPSDIKTNMLNPLTVLGYCGIGGAGFTKGSGWGDTANCIYYPATKEQRDILFQKMEEAGYMWDSKNMELQKIEQKSAWSEEDDIMANDICYALRCQITYPISRIQSMSTWISNFKDRVQPQPKQEWSEEDEDILNTIINHFKIDIECTDEDDTVRWLKFLKERYTWKPSKEQLNNILDVLLTFDNCTPEMRKLLESLYQDLKKLKAL